MTTTLSVIPSSSTGSGCTLATLSPSASICGEAGIYIGKSSDELIDLGPASNKQQYAASCTSTIECLSFGLSEPSTGELGVCNLYQGTVSQLQHIIDVAPIGRQALQTFRDIGCFTCPSAAIKMPAILSIPLTSTLISLNHSGVSSSVQLSTLSVSMPIVPTPAVCTFQNAVLQIDTTGHDFGSDYAFFQSIPLIRAPVLS